MSLGQWLNAIILEQAADEGIHDDDADRHDDSGDDLATINRRLDDLGRQIARLAGQPAAAPPRDQDAGARQIAEAILKLNGRLDQLIAEGRSSTSALEQRVNSVDQALAKLSRERVRAAASYTDGKPVSVSIEQATAEIAARQRALDAEFGAPSAAMLERPALAPIPCRTGEAVDGLRQDLAEIGRTLAEAMPRRAVEALEGEVRALGQRLDAERRAGGATPTVARLEQGLQEVRDALRRLAPAESLVGFDQAVRIMSSKIDVIAAARQDPGNLQQLESAIASLRSLVGELASSETLAALAKEVRALGDRIERGAPSGGADALAALERRIGTIADAIEAVRQQNGRNAALPIDQLMSALDAKLGQLQPAPAALSTGAQQALGGLEARIGKLVEKLEASEGRLGHLDTVERGVSDLLVHLDAMRAAKSTGDAGAAPAGRSAGPVGAAASVALPSPDVAALTQAPSAGERRIEETPHGQDALEPRADRIATIDTTVRNDARAGAPASDGSELPLAPPPAGPSLASPAAPARRPAAVRPAPAPRAPIDPSLPADHPLEPGSGPPRARPGAGLARPANAAERVAASEAPLRVNGVAAEPEPKANYLQAARRAAQLAQMAQTAQRGDDTAAGDAGKRGGKVVQRMRLLLVGLSVVLLIVAGLHYAASIFQVAELAPQPAAAESEAPVIVARPAAAAPSADAAPLFLAPVVPPSPAIVIVPPVATVPPPSPIPATELAPPPQPALALQPSASSADQPPPAPPPAPAAAPLPAPPAAAPVPPPSASADVTGSVAPRQPAASSAVPAPAAANADRLPAAIGSPGLIAAATAGEPAAAYEVATRFAEGRGVPRSLGQAAPWYERAAKAGLAPALFRLGALYEKGEGVTKDLNEARRLYLAAADKGNVNAMHNIGVLYAEGIDGKPDFKVAAQWFRRSAMFGIADSQYNLAVLYARGLGIERDMTEAYRWFALAAKAGDTDAGKKRDDIAARLDPKSLATARHAVDTWVADQPPEDAATVKPPPGGWDQAQPAAKRKARPGAHAVTPI